MNLEGKWISTKKYRYGAGGTLYLYLMKRVPDFGYIGISVNEIFVYGGIVGTDISDDYEIDIKFPPGYKIDDSTEKRIAIMEVFKEAAK